PAAARAARKAHRPRFPLCGTRRAQDAAVTGPASTRQRLDKWLWHARVTKSRTLAQKLIESGAVRVNGQRVTGSDTRVGAGDGLTILVHGRLRVLKIAGLAERRG